VLLRKLPQLLLSRRQRLPSQSLLLLCRPQLLLHLSKLHQLLRHQRSRLL
jgi:hypothetical protein